MLIGARPKAPPSRAERGIATILVGLLLLPLLAMAGLAVDLGSWYARASEIQRAADAAALAGVTVLPQGFTEAVERATDIAAQNGFDNAEDGITVTVAPAGPRRLRVTIHDSQVERFFTSMFTDSTTLERTSTAEYILPVPLGSPRNFLGTNRLLAGNEENFWLSVSGYCARREHGDRLTPHTDANHDPGSGAFEGCDEGVNGVRLNPEWEPDRGYFYGLDFLDGDDSHFIQIYDAPQCQFEGTGDTGDSGADSAASQRDYVIRIWPPSLTPGVGNDPLYEEIISPSDCASMRDSWYTIPQEIEPEAGDRYYFEMTPLEPADHSVAEGQNQFSLRVQTNGSFTPCATAPGEPGFMATCPVNLFGLTDLGVYANAAGSNPSFYLADVGPEHSGKVMEVQLFDPAEGAQAIQLIPPTSTPATQDPVDVTWEIACQDGTYQSDTGDNCTSRTGENAPPGGYGPFGPTDTIDVSGSVDPPQRPWGARNSQNGRYSDRLIRARLTLPDIEDFGGLTWWRIRYIVGSSGLGDRTTWSVSITGDPVRLVPNE